MTQKSRQTPKVDYTFVKRRRILELLEQIEQMQAFTPWEIDRKMDELFSLGPHVPDVLLELLRQCDNEQRADILAFALEYLDDEVLIEPLVEILIAPETAEGTKLRLLSTLAYYGLDTEDEAFAVLVEEAFEDVEAVMQRSTEQMLEAMQSDEEATTVLLENYLELPTPAKREMVKQFGEMEDERAVELLKVVTFLDDSAVAHDAIEYLKKIKTSYALSALDEIASETLNETLKKLAEKAAQRLKLEGIEVSKTEHTPGESYKTILSYFDGTGSRILWFAQHLESDSSSVKLTSLLFRTGFGLVDCYGVKSIPVSEFERMLRTLQEEVGCDEISYEYGVTLLKDALWQNHKNENSPPATYFLWKTTFQGENISPHAYMPEWKTIAPNFEALKSDQERLEESYMLHERTEFINWIDASPETDSYTAELDVLMENYSGFRLRREIDKLLKQYAAEVFEPQRNFIRQNLASAADHLFRQSGKTRAAEVTLVAALHLEEHAMPALEEHPFIWRMMEESLKSALLEDF